MDWCPQPSHLIWFSLKLSHCMNTIQPLLLSDVNYPFIDNKFPDVPRKRNTGMFVEWGSDYRKYRCDSHGCNMSMWSMFLIVVTMLFDLTQQEQRPPPHLCHMWQQVIDTGSQLAGLSVGVYCPGENRLAGCCIFWQNQLVRLSWSPEELSSVCLIYTQQALSSDYGSSSYLKCVRTPQMVQGSK